MAIENRKARFEYDISDTFTAGIVLEGWEVKSVAAGSANLKSAWVTLKEGEAWIENFTISPWKYAQGEQPQNRSKKLLLKKNELKKLEQKFTEKGYTLIPLKVFTKNGYLKCEVAIGRGRKKYEKRQVLKDRDTKRAAERAMKG